MSWIKDTFAQWQISTSDPMSRVDVQSSNMANQSQARAQDPRNPGEFSVGMVLDSCAGAYYSIVRTQGGPDLPCVSLGTMNCVYMGANESNLPVEGSRVLVYKPEASANFGVILGQLPSVDSTANCGSGTTAGWSYAAMWDVEPSASAGTEMAYDDPISDPDDIRAVLANSSRAVDAFPGDWLQFNDRDVGFMLGRFMATMHGSDRARIDVSLIDDLVRVIAGYLRVITAQGETQTLNDGGYPTMWHSATSHQCEKSGYADYGSPVVEDVGEGPQLPQSTASRFKLKEEDLMSKRRLQAFTGWLGDMLDVFVAKPDPATTPLKYSDDSKDQGLCHMHVDSCGRMVVRSAAGISLQRWDRIPVPKQKYELWDPEGDKIEENYEPTEKKPVAWPDDHKYGRSLQIRDGYAWIHKMGYQRQHDQSVQAGMKDINLPEESELQTPDKKYDELGKAEEDYQRNNLRQSYFNIEDDGSIILRDTWGSEIIMRGGNIIFNCPGQIEVRPGKSLVMLAGDDLVAKAKNSVDITATDKDVRIKAEGNLHLLSEGREGARGGILLESKSDGEGAGFKGQKGENVVSRGIILKAVDSSIFSQARTVHSSCERYHKIECFGEDEDNDGQILFSGRKLTSNMKQQTLLTTDKYAACFIGRHQAILAGQSTMLVAKRSVAILKGAKAWIPLMEIPIETDVYDSVQPLVEMTSDFLQDTPWLSPFLPDLRPDIEFTYRTSQQYNTMVPSEIHEATEFRVYQASWAYLKGVGFHTLTGVNKTVWAEYPIEDTWPWPGEEHYTGGTAYTKLEKEANIENPATGIPKARSNVTEAVGGFTKHSFNEYEVVL